MNDLIQNHFPIHINFNNTEVIIYISQINNHLFMNTNSILSDINRWKRIKSVSDLILDVNNKYYDFKSVLSIKNKGTWIIYDLFESFGNYYGSINNLTGFGTYLKNHIKQIIGNHDPNSDPCFTSFTYNNKRHILRANRHTDFINLTDILSIYDKDIRTWKKTKDYNEYVGAHPSHITSDNSSVDEFGMRTSYGHPNIARKLLEYLHKNNNDKVFYDNILEFINQDVAEEEIVEIQIEDEIIEEDEVVEEVMEEKYSVIPEKLEIIAHSTVYNNPVNKLNISNLKPEDFEGCRMTPDGKFSVYDVISKFKACSPAKATQTYVRLKSDEVTNCDFMDSYQFLRSDGKKGKPTPVCTFSELLTILSQLPGEQAKILRREQAEITTRAIAGDSNLREFVEERERTVPQETRDVLMTGLEKGQCTIKDVHEFYDKMRSDTKYRVSIDLSQYNNKDILYIGIFRPSEEYLRENIDVLKLEHCFFYKFGVSKEVISRSGVHVADKDFTDYTVIKVFEYHNSFGKSSAETRLKTILTNMNLRVKYCGKDEIFVSTLDDLDIIFEQMKIHNETMNGVFEAPFADKLELEKIKMGIQKEIDLAMIQKEIEIEKLNKEKEVEKEKILRFAELFEKGKLTFEQFGKMMQTV